MTPSPQPHRKDAAGFTLLEMLIVLTIIALVAGLAMPVLSRRMSDATRLQATAFAIIGALRLTRAAAIARNTEVGFSIDLEARTFGSAVVPTRNFDPDIVAQMKIAGPERLTAVRDGFRFFPDGSSTGGDLRLLLNDKEMRICINWLSGDVRQGANC